MCSRPHSAAPSSVLLVGLLLTAGLAGCGTLATGGDEGGSENADRGETDLTGQGDVRSVDRKQQVADCTFLTKVTVDSSPFFGANDVKNKLRNEAAGAGGNVVLITNVEGQTARGKAYECPAEDDEGTATEGDDPEPMPQQPPPEAPATAAASTPSDPAPRVVSDSTVEGALRGYVSAAWCGEGLAQSALYRARRIYRYEHCTEIQETLEVVDVRTVVDATSQDRVAAAFFRYSVGTKIFRDVLWFRRVEGEYARTDARPPSEPGDRWGNGASALMEEAENWKAGSALWYE